MYFGFRAPGFGGIIEDLQTAHRLQLRKTEPGVFQSLRSEGSISYYSILSYMILYSSTVYYILLSSSIVHDMILYFSVVYYSHVDRVIILLRAFEHSDPSVMDPVLGIWAASGSACDRTEADLQLLNKNSSSNSASAKQTCTDMLSQPYLRHRDISSRSGLGVLVFRVPGCQRRRRQQLFWPPRPFPKTAAKLTK